MLKHLILPLLVAGVVLTGAAAFIAGGIGALAHEEARCDASTTSSPFIGLAGPDAPYDLRFIDEMIMHHRGAIVSSEMMIADSEHPELRNLAQRIQKSQQQQIDQMLDWRAEWYPDAPTPAMSMEKGSGSMGSMMDGSMGGMMHGMTGSDSMMAGMMRGMMGSMMDGGMADQMFLRMMIPHHRLALEMAEDALINAEHAELKRLAQEIIDGQSTEIIEMEGYLKELYDEMPADAAAGTMRTMMRSMMGS